MEEEFAQAIAKARRLQLSDADIKELVTMLLDDTDDGTDGGNGTTDRKGATR